MKALRSITCGWSWHCPDRLDWAAELPTAKPESLGFSSERLARIGPAIQREIDKGQYPGAVMLVARKGRIVYFESLGQLDPASTKPMRKDAIFRLYSMTSVYVRGDHDADGGGKSCAGLTPSPSTFRHSQSAGQRGGNGSL